MVANIGNVEGVQAALDAGAEGVGLLRSEFLYLERSSLPSEEEQFQKYKLIADAFGDKPVILRTLDIGGDKEIPYIDLPRKPIHSWESGLSDFVYPALTCLNRNYGLL